MGVLVGVLLAGSLALSGCSPAPPVTGETHGPAAPIDKPEAPVAALVVEQVSEPIVETVAEQVQDVVEAVPLPEPPPAPPARTVPISDGAITLLVNTEIGSEAMYRRRFTRPVWPGGASGVTIGVGVDLGQMRQDEIRYDWEQHPQLDALLPAAGFQGEQARLLTAHMQDVITEFPLALDVFLRNDVLQYYRMSVRAYPGMEALGLNAQGVLVSLTFNRGGVIPKTCTPGSSRYEMCMIRDECVPEPATAGACIARWLRTMKRVWAGKKIERGMRSRREQEAKLAELPDV